MGNFRFQNRHGFGGFFFENVAERMRHCLPEISAFDLQRREAVAHTSRNILEKKSAKNVTVLKLEVAHFESL